MGRFRRKKVVRTLGFVLIGIAALAFVLSQFVSVSVTQRLVPVGPLYLAIDDNAPISEITAILDAEPSLAGKPSGHGVYPIVQAVSANRADVVLLLLQRGADPNVADQLGSPLARAATNNNIEIGRILLEHGADPESQGLLGITVRQICQDESHREFRELLDSREAEPVGP